MKNFELKIAITLVVLTGLTLMFSCQKNEKPQENIDKIGYEKMRSYLDSIDKFSSGAERRSNPNQFYFTCADSWGNEFDLGNKGLAAEVDVVKFRVGGATMKSWWIALDTRYTDAQGNQVRDWTQFGYAVDKGGVFPAFFRYRWVNGSQRQAPPNIIYTGVNVPLEYGTRVRFEIKNIEGSTWWTFSRSDQEVFRADLEITETNGNREACTESWGGGTFSPAVMTYYMDGFKDGVWSHIPHGISNQFSWGIQGRNQKPEFIQSQFVIGGNTPLPVGTPWLWHP